MGPRLGASSAGAAGAAGASADRARLRGNATITTPLSRSEEAHRVRRDIERHQLQSRLLRSAADELPVTSPGVLAMPSSVSSPSLLYAVAGATGDGATSSATSSATAQADSAAPASDNRLGIHHGVECDGCGASPIRGLRFKCTTCPDYDLCRTCYRHRHDIHTRGHSFRWVSHHGGRSRADSGDSGIDRAHERMQAQQFIREANRHNHETKESDRIPHVNESRPRSLESDQVQFYCHQCQGGFSLPTRVAQASPTGPSCPTCQGYFVEQWEGIVPLRVVPSSSSSPSLVPISSLPSRRRRRAGRGLVTPSLPSVEEVERVLMELQLLQAALSQRGDLLQRALQEQSLLEDGNKPIPASEETIASLKNIVIDKKSKEAAPHCSICLDC